MPKFRKKPVVIDALKVSEIIERAKTELLELPEWIQTALYEATLDWTGDGGLFVNTLEGQMRGEPDDFIIRGVAGELYPCKSDIFEATYEPVEE